MHCLTHILTVLYPSYVCVFQPSNQAADTVYIMSGGPVYIMSGGRRWSSRVIWYKWEEGITLYGEITGAWLCHY